MSRMTKFLKQSCVYKKALKNSSGVTLLDKYGNVKYDEPKIIKCRKEKIIKEIHTETGSLLQSYIRYFTDESVTINVNDSIDDKPVTVVEEYINQLGQLEGFESYV